MPQTTSAASGTTSPPVFDVFLSYNNREKAVVERIAERLKRKGVEPWLDRWCLTPGGDWQDEIAEGMRRSSSCAIFVELNGHVGSVLSATFDPSGQYILTTSGFTPTEDERDIPPYGADETRVWDLKTGSSFHEFRDPGVQVLSGAFLSDGKSILVVDASGMVYSYSCDLCLPQDELLRLAQKRSVRQLTPDERARYLHESRGD